jgi:CheY-like chemotaxis protein
VRARPALHSDGGSISTKTGAFDRVLTKTAEGICNGWGTIVTTWVFDGLRLNLDGQQNCGDFINSNSLTTARPGTVAPASAFRPAPDAMFEKMRSLQVLLVDDDVSVLGVLTGLLESLGHAVISADNAADAELAFSGHGQVEVLLSDYNLAETTGLILAKRFTAHKPQLRVILMSGGDPGQETLNEIRSRDWAFLSKPMSHSDLVKALKNSSSPCMAD